MTNITSRFCHCLMSQLQLKFTCKDKFLKKLKNFKNSQKLAHVNTLFKMVIFRSLTSI